MKTKRIFVSLPADQWLSKEENKTKWAIVTAVEDLGYTTEVFLDPRGTAHWLLHRRGVLQHANRSCVAVKVVSFLDFRGGE